MQPCFMLRKCMSADDDDEGIEVKVNCSLNSSCCGGGKIEDTIINEPPAKDKKDRGGGKEIEGDILQSKAPGRSSINNCLSCCCKTTKKKSKRMAHKATDIYTSSEGIQALSNS